MSWRILAVVCGLGLITASQTTQVAPVTAMAQRPVVIATLPCQPSLQSTSSGFVIDDETVVTVAHAIYETRDFAVRDSTGRWFRPEILHMDVDRDLAVLRIPGLRASPMATRVAGAGDAVEMVEGAASGTTEGAVLRRVRLTTESIGDLERKTARSGYEMSVAIRGGDSGAAIVDQDENLVGVVFARSTRREAAWVTSVTEILSVLDKQGVPPWECENPSSVELILEAPELDEKP